MSNPWNFLSDELIIHSLSDTANPLDEDFTRLMCIELLTRVRKLETENHAQRLVLQEFTQLSDEDYRVLLNTVKDFLHQQDTAKSEQASFFQNSGISFTEWVRLFTQGTFSQ